MPIVVSGNSLGGPVCDLTIEPAALVWEIKGEIQKHTAIPAREQCLLHECNELNDTKCLCDYVSSACVDLTLVRRSPLYTTWLSRVSEDGRTLKHAPKWIRAEREIVAAAVRENPKAIRYASPDLQDSLDIGSCATVSRSQRTPAYFKLVFVIVLLLVCAAGAVCVDAASLQASMELCLEYATQFWKREDL
eukprot:TRINITY_DN66930_c0_g1_i1.p1 TRINITY_DN66930_c0_g1~~TRINITY_DN66930_c0_g1_i1.p1  ORF type:complete len:191 (+),score=23.80 TRINITY_DN66930_c0_g1_i1:54-626(+)